MSKGRAGSRKVRVYVFREWLMRTYGSYLSREIMASEEGADADPDADADVDDATAVTVPEDSSVVAAARCQSHSNRKRKRKLPGISNNGIVLDVAGGKGDLSWLLKNVDGLESIVLDPWKPDPNSVSRNERMVRSIEYLRKNPEETKTRSVPGLLTFQPLAGLLPRLLEERTKRLRKNQTNKIQHLGDNEESLSSSPSNANCAAEESLDNGNTDGPCRPEDFLTPRILHVPLDEIMVQKVRNRINMDKAKMEAEGGKFTDKNNHDVHKFKQHTTRTDDPTREDSDGILDLLSSGRIKLILGFHSDQATEPCIDLARVLGIPCCVVPCCVFPAEFPNRRLRLAPTLHSSLQSSSSSSKDGNNSDKDGNNNSNDQKGESLVPVRTYQQFLDYLRIKATTPTHAKNAISSDSDDSPSTIHTAYLNFPFTETAKNIVLYTLPPSHPSADSSPR